MTEFEQQLWMRAYLHGAGRNGPGRLSEAGRAVVEFRSGLDYYDAWTKNREACLRVSDECAAFMRQKYGQVFE